MQKKSIILFLVMTGLFLSAFPNLGFTSRSNEDIVIGKVVRLKSKILNEERRIFIHLPEGYSQSNQRYPVLCVLVNEEPTFHFPSGAVRFLADIRQIPKMIVVGLGDINGNRDLTPTPSDPYGRTSGGAKIFVQYIKEEVIPYIDQNYRTQPCRIFQGHSIVSAFGVYAFLSEPDLFQAYILSSPYFVYDQKERYLLKNTKSFIKNRKSQNNFLYLTVGNEHQLIECIKEFIGKLEQNPKGVEWKYTIRREEDHTSIMANVLIDGLRSIFVDWKSIPSGCRVR